jgi:hypothetical protein
MESIVSSEHAYRAVTQSPFLITKLGIGLKVQPLFLDRRLSDYLYQAGVRHSHSTGIFKKLGLLQHAIYELDKYGESTWELVQKELDEIWAGIYSQLRRWGIVENKQAESVTKEIKLYQYIESDLRRSISPIHIPIHRFYHLKTCDVRLARRLIAAESRDTLSQILLVMWNNYDLVSEVCDDLTDVAEDAVDFNCNRFVIQLGLQGGERTRSDYIAFLDAIRAEMLKLLDHCGRSSAASQLNDWFLSRLITTVELLDKQTDLYNTFHSTAQEFELSSL